MQILARGIIDSGSTQNSQKMTRGNQRDKDRERAQARAAKQNKTGNSCTGQAKMDQAEIMRQKQAAAEARKAAAAAGGGDQGGGGNDKKGKKK